MATKLFYPIGKCEEQVIATNQESRLFAYLLLRNIKLLLEENDTVFSGESIERLNGNIEENYFHYVKTIKDPCGIEIKVGYRFVKNGKDFMVDVCEYRFIKNHVLCKLMGRLNYDMQKQVIGISSIRYYSVNEKGISVARYPRVQDYCNEKIYFGASK